MHTCSMGAIWGEPGEDALKERTDEEENDRYKVILKYLK